MKLTREESYRILNTGLYRYWSEEELVLFQTFLSDYPIVPPLLFHKSLSNVLSLDVSPKSPEEVYELLSRFKHPTIEDLKSKSPSSLLVFIFN